MSLQSRLRYISTYTLEEALEELDVLNAELEEHEAKQPIGRCDEKLQVAFHVSDILDEIYAVKQVAKKHLDNQLMDYFGISIPDWDKEEACLLLKAKVALI